MTHIIENKGEFALEGVDESYEKIRIVLISKKPQRNQRCGSWERCVPHRGHFVLSHAPAGAMQRVGLSESGLVAGLPHVRFARMGGAA